MRLRKGQRVRVRLAGGGDGDWCEGVVAVASDTNPQSVGLLLDGAVRDSRGGITIGALPLTINYAYDAESAVSLLGDEYEIDVAEVV